MALKKRSWPRLSASNAAGSTGSTSRGEWSGQWFALCWTNLGQQSTLMRKLKRCLMSGRVGLAVAAGYLYLEYFASICFMNTYIFIFILYV